MSKTLSNGGVFTDAQWNRIERRRRLGGFIYQSRETVERIAAGEMTETDAVSASQRAYVRMVRDALALD